MPVRRTWRAGRCARRGVGPARTAPRPPSIQAEASFGEFGPWRLNRANPVERESDPGGRPPTSNGPSIQRRVAPRVRTGMVARILSAQTFGLFTSESLKSSLGYAPMPRDYINLNSAVGNEPLRHRENTEPNHRKPETAFAHSPTGCLLHEQKFLSFSQCPPCPCGSTALFRFMKLKGHAMR